MTKSETLKFPTSPFPCEEALVCTGEVNPPLEVLEPKALLCPLVFSSPHSGRSYPKAFLAAARLDSFALRRSEDAHVDDLFLGATHFGAPLIRAFFPRAYLDVNREPFELDPKMFDGRLPPFANTRSARVAAGLGTIPRVVAESQEIYRHRLPVSEAIDRIEALYKPYHRALRRLMQRALEGWGCALLVDCHSMPSASAGTGADHHRPDVVIGDRFGTSCHSAIVQTLTDSFRRRGYAVQRNIPYAGGFITEHYGNPDVGAHAVQVEINRSLYLDERSLSLTAGAVKLAQELTEIMADLADSVGRGLAIRPAAE